MLTTLSAAKLHLRIDGTDEDALITAQIEAAETLAAHFLNRHVYADQAALSAAFAAASDLHTIARAENGRVVLEFPRIAEDGYGSAGELKVAAGTTASATNTIFGANDGFAWPDAAGANDMTWFPVDVQFAINGLQARSSASVTCGCRRSRTRSNPPRAPLTRART